jgi:plastocyanin
MSDDLDRLLRAPLPGDWEATRADRIAAARARAEAEFANSYLEDDLPTDSGWRPSHPPRPMPWILVAGLLVLSVLVVDMLRPRKPWFVGDNHRTTQRVTAAPSRSVPVVEPAPVATPVPVPVPAVTPATPVVRQVRRPAPTPAPPAVSPAPEAALVAQWAAPAAADLSRAVTKAVGGVGSTALVLEPDVSTAAVGSSVGLRVRSAGGDHRVCVEGPERGMVWRGTLAAGEVALGLSASERTRFGFGAAGTYRFTLRDGAGEDCGGTVLGTREVVVAP